MRLHEVITEMAQPSAETKSSRLFHGTSTESAAQSILRDGLQPGASKTGRGHLAPVAGKLYLTPSIEYALIYALGCAMIGQDIGEDRIKRGGQYGYVFEIDSNELRDIQPDEDSVGDFVYKHAQRKTNPMTKRFIGWEFRPDGVDDAKKKWVWDNCRSAMTDRQFTGSCDGMLSAQASGGKRALRALSQPEQLALISWGAHIAHHGGIMPKACWRIDKSRSKELAKDGSNFFDIADSIPMGGLSESLTEASEAYRGVVEPGSRPRWGQTINLSKPVVAYHATHEGLGKVLTNRDIKTYDSMGTYLTSNREMAQEMYGPNVEAYQIPPGQYLLAKRNQDFWELVLNCLPIIEQTVGKAAADHLRKFPLTGTNLKWMKDVRQQVKKYLEDGGERVEFVPVSLVSQALQYSDPDKVARYKALDKSTAVYREICKNADYCKQYRAFLESSGYRGIIWNRRFWDNSEQSQTIFLVFHNEDLHPIKQVKDPSARPSPRLDTSPPNSSEPRSP